MVASTRAAQQYKQTQVRSSSPLELVVLLYDGALSAMTAAADAMARGDIPARKAALAKALAIIAELQNTLDLQQGGEIAAELDRLYVWITSQLVDAAVRQDAAPIHSARRVLETLSEAWHQIAQHPAAPGSAA
jgi:flagellar protein FliS